MPATMKATVPISQTQFTTSYSGDNQIEILELIIRHQKNDPDKPTIRHINFGPTGNEASVLYSVGE